MKKRMIAGVFTLVLGAIALTGCGGSKTQDNGTAVTGTETSGITADDTTAGDTVKEEKTGGSIKIGVSQKANTNPYNIEVAEAIQAAIKEGDSVILTDAQQNQAKQISDVEDLIQQGCDVILISPVDWKGTRGMLEACERAGVYGIVIDQNIPEEDAVYAASVVCSDNYKAGQYCAESMVKAIDGKGDIVIYESTISKAGVDRVAGFEDYIADYPEIKVVNRQDGIGQIEASLPVMENMLQSDPDIVGVFAFNDPAAIGCIAAVESANKIDKIVVYGVDGSEQGIDMIQNGKMAGTAAQFPALLGTTAIETAYKLMAGETVEKNIFIPVEFIDENNVSQFAN